MEDILKKTNSEYRDCINCKYCIKRNFIDYDTIKCKIDNFTNLLKDKKTNKTYCEKWESK